MLSVCEASTRAKKNILSQDMTKHTTHSADETFELARNFAAKLTKGDVLALEGELGAGKTRFVQGLAAGLGVPSNVFVRSPTFALLNEYRGGRLPLYHFDFYRLHAEEDLVDIGVEEFFYGDGISVVEWADMFPNALPHHARHITFDIVGETERVITIRAASSRGKS